MTGTSYYDPSLTNGTTYYYVVTAYSQSVESPYSSQVSGTPEVPPDLVVTSLADDGSAGTLRYETQQAEYLAGDQTIVFAPSLTQAGPATLVLNGTTLSIDDPSGTLTINGPSANLLSITQDWGSTLVNDAGSTAVILGLNVTGVCNDGSLTVSDCTMTGKSTNALDNYDGGILNVDDCTISGNSTWDAGGGIYSNGTLTVSDSTITGNSVGGSGGGIYAKGTISIVNSTITGNTAGESGGGIYANGTIIVVNSTIGDNYAGISGGGIYLASGTTADITDCTISGNSAGLSAGGVDGGGQLYGSIVAGNTKGDLYGTFTGTNNLIGDGTRGLSSATNILPTGATPLDPLLAPLGDYGGTTETMPLMPGSPAIGHGESISGITTDQRGAVRSSTAPDIGAFEGSVWVVNTLNDQVDSLSSSTVSLRDAIDRANSSDGLFAVIMFASSLTTGGPVTINLTGGILQVDSSESVAIDGSGANLLTINADGHSGVFSVDAGVSAQISGLTITGGSAATGAGIDNAGNLTISSCSITGDSASGNGGGIYNSADLNVSYCTISGDSSGSGDGGGVDNVGGGADIGESAVFDDSAADGDGGGLANFAGGTLFITNTTVADDSAVSGGGIENDQGAVSLIDSTVSGDTATAGSGGGIAINDATGASRLSLRRNRRR